MRATPYPSYATQHVKLTIATADTDRLIRAALWGLRRIYRPGFQYKKTGILFLDLAQFRRDGRIAPSIRG